MLKEGNDKRHTHRSNIKSKPYQYRIRKKENLNINVEEDICFTKKEVDFVLNNLELFFS